MWLAFPFRRARQPLASRFGFHLVAGRAGFFLGQQSQLQVAQRLAIRPQQSDPPLDQQFPGPNGRANFRKIVSGDFTGDLRRDAVFMDQNTVVLLKSPAIYDTRITLPFPVNDIAVVPVMVALHEALQRGATLPEALLAARRAAGGDPLAEATAHSFLALGA
jgi:hypothetical protein